MAERRYSPTLGASGARRRNTTAIRKASLQQAYTRLETKKTSQNFKKLVVEMRKQLDEIKKKDIVPLTFEEIQARVSDLDLESERLSFMLQAAQSTNTDPETTLALNEAIASISDVTDEYQAVLLEGRALPSSLIASVGGYAARAVKRKVFGVRNSIIERGVENLRSDSFKGVIYRWGADRSRNNNGVLARGFRWYTGLNSGHSAEEMLTRIKKISRIPTVAPPPPPPAPTPPPAAPVAKAPRNRQRGSGKRTSTARMRPPPKTARDRNIDRTLKSRGFETPSEKEAADFKPGVTAKADVSANLKGSSGFDYMFGRVADTVKSVGAIFSGNSLASQLAQDAPNGDALRESKRQHAETTKLYKQALKSEAEFREQAKKNFNDKFNRLLDTQEDIVDATKKGLKWGRGLLNWGKGLVGLGGAATAGAATAGTVGGLAAAARPATSLFSRTLGLAGKVAVPVGAGLAGYDLLANQRDEYGNKRAFFGDEETGFIGSRAVDYGGMIAAGAGLGSFFPGIGTLAGGALGAAAAGTLDLLESIFNDPSDKLQEAAVSLIASSNFTKEQQEKVLKRISETYGPEMAKAVADEAGKKIEENLKALELMDRINALTRGMFGLPPGEPTVKTVTAHKRNAHTSEQFTGTGDSNYNAQTQKRTLPQYKEGTFTGTVNGETHAFEPDANSPTGYTDVGVYDFRRVNGPVEVDQSRLDNAVMQDNANFYSGEGNAITPSGHKGPFASLLNRIANSEGTATQANSGYDTEYAYGKFSPGSDKKISEMSLDELDAYQTGMLDMPGNDIAGLGSSAVGRYQYIRTTMRDFRNRYDPNSPENLTRAAQGKKSLYDKNFRKRADDAGLSFTGTETFSPEFQDKLASFDIMERAGGRSFMAGESSPEQFQNDVAAIWASVPTTAGVSAHGQGTKGSVESWMGANAEMRDAFQGNYITTEPNYTPPSLLSQGKVPVKASDGSTRWIDLSDPNSRTGQAFGGGEALAGTYSAANELMGLGGVERFTGFDDHAHEGTTSKHDDGLAGDFTLKDLPRDYNSLTDEHKTIAAQKASDVRAMFAARGLVEGKDFTVLDEYNKPSRNATAPHLHYQFNTQEAADKYNASYQEALKKQRESAPSSMPMTANASKFDVFGPQKEADPFQIAYTPGDVSVSPNTYTSVVIPGEKDYVERTMAAAEARMYQEPVMLAPGGYDAAEKRITDRHVVIDPPTTISTGYEIPTVVAADAGRLMAFETKSASDPFQFTYEGGSTQTTNLGANNYAAPVGITPAPILPNEKDYVDRTMDAAESRIFQQPVAFAPGGYDASQAQISGASGDSNIDGGAGRDTLIERRLGDAANRLYQGRTAIESGEYDALASGVEPHAPGAHIRPDALNGYVYSLLNEPRARSTPLDAMLESKKREVTSLLSQGDIDPAMAARQLFAIDNPSMPIPASIPATMEKFVTEKLGVDIFSPGAFQYGPSIANDMLKLPAFDLFGKDDGDDASFEIPGMPSVRPMLPDMPRFNAQRGMPDFAYYPSPPVEPEPIPIQPTEPQVIVMPAPKEKERKPSTPIMKNRPPPITLDEPVMDPSLAKLLAWDRDE